MRIVMRGVTLAAVLAMTSTAVSAAPRETRYLGYATEQGSGRYLYTEVHRHQYDGVQWRSGNIRYVAPDGRLLGEKSLDFSRDPYVPLMRYRLPGAGYEERITAVSVNGLQLEKVRNGQVERKTLPRLPDLAADSGFNALLVDKLATLEAGKPVSLRLAVVGQLDQYRFRILPQGRIRVGDEQALRLRIQPDSLLRLLVDPIDVVYGLTSRELLQYRGVSNVLNPATGKAYLVDIDYRRKPASAPGTLPAP